MSEAHQSEVTSRIRDRRLTPRYPCCGRAQITYLPSDGALFRGRLRNLGLGGCYIETGLPLPVGARTEVLLEANALFFRAMAQVRVVRQNSGIGLQFIRLSTGGIRSLAEVLVELEQQQAVIGSPVLRDEKLLSEFGQSVWFADPALAPSDKLALVGTVAPPPSLAQVSPETSGAILEVHPKILDADPSGSILDLFG